ncbi:hypothetical protein EDD21DRAFT_378415 [Dissophora ornata]|nr:hypothetical protein BGZ58_007501 [Dissophora ornata]KAI8599961.1 hypothetical protein EDD21DRAFT_378415 [Dissophora ornata]
MATAPLLRRETTRTLCDQFTTIFDTNDCPLSSPALSHAHLSSQSLAAAAHSSDLRTSSDKTRPAPRVAVSRAKPLDGRNLLRETDLESVLASSVTSLPETHPSPASTVFTPASTPCSESDDSTMLDTLSPPSSPWFPSALELGEGPKESHQRHNIGHAGKSNNSRSAKFAYSHPHHNIGDTVDDLDFFNNSFYQSLPDVHNRPNSQYPYQCSTFIATAVRSARATYNSTESCKTAAPSDLYNVTIDEILSTDPLNLAGLDVMEPVVTEMAEMEADMAILSEALEASNDELAMASEQVSNSQSSISSEETVEDVYEQELNDFDSESSQDVDFDERPTKKQRTSASRRRSSSLKAPRAKKQAVKRVPKVYPPRKPRVQAVREEHPEGFDGDKSISSSNSSSRVASSSSLSLSASSLGVPALTATSIKEISTATVMPMEDGCYHCDHCPNERFGRVHDLKRHQISKHNEKTWPCDFCHRPFVRRDALLRHYAVKSARRDDIHPTAQDSQRLSEARARARLIS